MFKHVKACIACGNMVKDLRRLEKDWKNQTLPEECEQAKAAFLRHLPRHEKAAKQQKPARRWVPTRWAVAASVLLCLGLATWLLYPNPSRASSSDLMERLLDWNLELNNADAKDRARLRAEKEAKFREELETEQLSEEERAEAQIFFDNGCALASTEDPSEEADRIQKIADTLQSRADSATTKGNEKEKERYQSCYLKVVARGIPINLARLDRLKSREHEMEKRPFEFEKKGEKKGEWDREHGFQKDNKMAHPKMGVMPFGPSGARPDLRKAMEALQKHMRRPQHGGKR